MRFLFVLLLISTSAVGQKNDSLTGPVNVIDGVYFSDLEECDHDSIAQIHRNVTFEIADSNTFNYTFQPGSSCYLELILKTKNCACKDCSYFRKFIIELSSISETLEVTLDPSNLTEIWWNSWRMPTKENNRSGTLKITNRVVSLKLLPYNDKTTNLLEPREEFSFTLKE